MTNEELQQLVESVSLTVFNKRFKHQAIFNKRLKTTGGRYHLADHHLDFNPKVYEIYGKDELIGVIKHELCHYHLHIEKKGYRHRDADFKNLLAKSGGLRYVKPLNDNKQSVTHRYQCTHCGQVFIRRRRINLTKYGCSCGSQLVYIDKI